MRVGIRSIPCLRTRLLTSVLRGTLHTPGTVRAGLFRRGCAPQFVREEAQGKRQGTRCLTESTETSASSPTATPFDPNEGWDPAVHSVCILTSTGFPLCLCNSPTGCFISNRNSSY